MIFIYAMVAVWHLAASSPLLFGVFCGYRYRNRRFSSRWLIVMLLAASVASLVILFASPSLLSMKYSNILLLLGGIVTGAIGLGFWIRRFRMVSLVWLIAGIAIAELAILAAVDHRFRIVVQNLDGVAVDVRDSEMALGHAGSSWGASFIDIREGTKLGEGEYYFGLLLWLQRKDEWTFCGYFHDSYGNRLGDLEWKSARWEEWPKHVIVDQNFEK
ncbi:hypothetical protein N9162_00700 [bacterium]|nr:hypothetical protein [Akkermansiaceae bacterium]MDB4440191.1 hypothetical protein [bacterium]